MKKIVDCIGNTPLIQCHSPNKNVEIFAKCEWLNPTGSVKDRAAFSITQSALQKGYLENKVLIDASSGNTGIAYAMLGAFYKFPVEIALPENATQQRKQILACYGAKLHLTSPMEGTDGAQNFVKEHTQKYPDKYYYPDQYNNDDNWQAHLKTTGPEIWHQTRESVSHFITGLGTTGTFMGTATFLRQKKVHCISVQPDNPMHGLEGWKHLPTALVPGIYDSSIAHEEMSVSTEKAYQLAKKAAKEWGLLISPSAAANLAAARKLATQLNTGKIVTVLTDGASKYLAESFWGKN